MFGFLLNPETNLITCVEGKYQIYNFSFFQNEEIVLNQFKFIEESYSRELHTY